MCILRKTQHKLDIANCYPRVHGTREADAGVTRTGRRGNWNASRCQVDLIRFPLWLPYSSIYRLSFLFLPSSALPLSQSVRLPTVVPIVYCTILINSCQNTAFSRANGENRRNFVFPDNQDYGMSLFFLRLFSAGKELPLRWLFEDWIWHSLVEGQEELG